MFTWQPYSVIAALQLQLSKGDLQHTIAHMQLHVVEHAQEGTKYSTLCLSMLAFKWSCARLTQTLLQCV